MVDCLEKEVWKINEVFYFQPPLICIDLMISCIAIYIIYKYLEVWFREFITLSTERNSFFVVLKKAEHWRQPAVNLKIKQIIKYVNKTLKITNSRITRFGSRGFGRPTFRQTCTSVVNHTDMDSLFPFLTKWEAHKIKLNFFLVQ